MERLKKGILKERPRQKKRSSSKKKASNSSKFPSSNVS
jgi:hypothetical protein